MRQDTDVDVPRAPTRSQGRELPLVEEDFETGGLPRPIKLLGDKCFGLLSTAARLSPVRGERRPGSTYASLAQCSYELRRAEVLYRTHRIPSMSSASLSVEEMAALIMQSSRLPDLGWTLRGRASPTSGSAPRTSRNRRSTVRQQGTVNGDGPLRGWLRSPAGTKSR